MKSKGIIIHIVSILIAIAGLFLGLETDFFGYFTDASQSAILASFSLGLLIFLIGERFALNVYLNNHQQNVLDEMDDWRRSIPEMNIVTRFKTCDDALMDIAKHLEEATGIYNTHISRDGIPAGEVATSSYKSALLTAIENGAIMVDVVSPQFETKMKEFQAHANGSNGEYTSYKCQVTAPCFLNFIILDYESGKSDLWIGWATSQSFGMEQPAYRIKDNNIINYFRTYHQALRS